MVLSAARALARPILVAGSVLGLVVASQAGLSGRAPAGAPTYTLQPGDTLTAVAGRFNVAIKDLVGANGIANPDFILVGDTLTIPGKAPAVTPATAAPAAQAAAPAPSGATDSKLPPGLQARPDRLALVPTFDRWAKAYGVAPDLLKALAWMESGWQNDVVSSVGARGIGQLTPDTSKFVSQRLLKTKLDAKVPEDNIRMSARFLAYLISQVGGDERLGLAAYYQGLGSLRKYGPLPVSRLYVDDITALRNLFS